MNLIRKYVEGYNLRTYGRLDWPPTNDPMPDINRRLELLLIAIRYGGLILVIILACWIARK